MPTPSPEGASPRSELRAAGLVALLAALPHVGSVAGDFTLDDLDFVLHNPDVRGLGAALGGFLRPFPPDDPDRGLYRPLTGLSFAVDQALGGGAPWIFHLSNVLLYGLLCVGVYLLIRRWAPLSQRAALLASGLFALHPVHCEAVDNITGRSDLLALGFGLLALGLARRSMALAAGAAALAMLSKEPGVMVPPVLVAAALFDPGQPATGPRWPRLLRAAAPLLLLPAYAILRGAALGQLGVSRVVGANLSPVERLCFIGETHLANLRLLVLPLELHLDFYYHQMLDGAGALTPSAALGLLLAGLEIGVLVKLSLDALLRPERLGSLGREIGLGLSIALLFALPTSHLVPFGAVIAERFLLAPSVGLALCLAALGARLPEQARPPALVAALALGTWFALLSSERAVVWRSAVTLWEREADGSRDARVWANLGQAALDAGDPERAWTASQQALALDPRQVPARNNVALLLAGAGRLDEADEQLRLVLEAAPNFATGWSNWGRLAMLQRRFPEAEQRFRRAIALEPRNIAANRGLAELEAAKAAGSAPSSAPEISR